MANLSRTKKYKDLRDSLQHEELQEHIQTKELSRFEKRLSQIDATNFAPSTTSANADFDASHARRTGNTTTFNTVEETSSFPKFDTQEKPTMEEEVDYLDQYIREVKQYNIEQGNAYSEDTEANLLKGVKGEAQKEQSGDRPYSIKDSIAEYEAKKASLSSPFVNRQMMEAEVEEYEESDDPFEVDSSKLSKEDIMAEVQNLVNGRRSQQALNSAQPVEVPTEKKQPVIEPQEDGYDQIFAQEQTNSMTLSDAETRAQILQETNSMRDQLNDYEENLSEVSEKIRHTDKIVNMLLIVLIVALAIMLGIIVYWIVITR